MPPKSHALSFFEALLSLPENVESIMTTVTELAGLLATITDQLAKAKTEILNKIAVLEDTINSSPVPPEVEAALENLKTAAQTLDDVVPDTAPEAAVSKR